MVTREQVLNFRQAGQGLIEQWPSDGLLAALSALNGRNSPPGSAVLAFNARVRDFTQAQFAQALATEKTILQTWSIAGNPYFFPTAETSLFTTALLPRTEAEWQAIVGSALKVYKGIGANVEDIVRQAGEAMNAALTGQTLTKGELSTAVSRQLPQAWLYDCPGCKARHLHETPFRQACWWGRICFGPASEKVLTFMRVEDWLGQPAPVMDDTQARSELVRRYLRSYGPSIPAHLGQWAGVAPDQARTIWQLIQEELIEVSFEGRKAWLLEKDLARLTAPVEWEGVRFLPPYDPYLLLRDRDTLIPDKVVQKEVWRILGNPGILLSGGHAVGLWRPQKKGKRLTLAVELFGPLPAQARQKADEEAQTLAPHKGCTSAEVVFKE